MIKSLEGDGSKWSLKIEQNIVNIKHVVGNKLKKVLETKV